MLNFFDVLIEYIKFAFDMLLGTVGALLGAVETLGFAIVIINNLWRSMPYFISSSFVLCIVVVVVNYLIGRDNA